MKKRLQTLIEQKISKWRRDGMCEPPKKFNCGEQRAKMRHVIAFISCIMLVMFTFGIYGIFKDGSATTPETEESGQEEQRMTEDGEMSAAQETERASVPAQAEEEEQEGPALRWQVYIHPDVPEPLAEILEQYEQAMNAGSNSNVPDDEKIELYYNWYDAMEAVQTPPIYYSLCDLTGDGFPELIMRDDLDVRIVYSCGEKEKISLEEYRRSIELYTQGEVELEWFSLCRPDWHILVSGNRDYDLYLEGISTDLWLNATVERQLYFSVYDKEGTLVQELVETSLYLPYMPDVYYAENTNIDWEEGWGHHAGNFYFQDMNFDGEEDLVLLWMNIRHAHWKVYLWREEEGVFREELPVNMADEFEGVFCYYNVVEEKKYIDEYEPDGATQTSICRWRYDEERGYLCVGALEVYYYRDQWETLDNRNERYQEYFYEDGICVGETEIISREEVSELWSDVLK